MHPDCWTNKEGAFIMAKTGRKNKKYSAEFKLSVIMDMRGEGLSYHETMRRYFPFMDERNFNFIKKWEKIYDTEGLEGLAKERRGRKSNMDGKKRGRPRKVKPEITNDLEAENKRLRERLEYLEAENAYLKKLSALIQQEEAQKAERNKK